MSIELNGSRVHPGSLADYLRKQMEWSERTFGPGRRTGGITSHIAKERDEIRAKPYDREEWIDVMILALDGYWRAGGRPKTVLGELKAKQKKNFARTWKRTSEDEATEHDRSRD